jgi:hypothetical protein
VPNRSSDQSFSRPHSPTHYMTEQLFGSRTICAVNIRLGSDILTSRSSLCFHCTDAVALSRGEELQLPTSDRHHALFPFFALEFHTSLSRVGGLHESWNNFIGSFNTDSIGGFTNVAPQPKLGVLPKRWVGPSGAGHTRSRSFGAALSLGAELLPLPRLRVLESCIPALCIAAVSLIENNSTFAHMM